MTRCDALEAVGMPDVGGLGMEGFGRALRCRGHRTVWVESDWN